MIPDPEIKHKQLFVGLDLSLTSTGVAFVWRTKTDTVRLHHMVRKTPKDIKGADRLRWIRDALMGDVAIHMGVLAEDMPTNHQTLIMIEGYAAQAKWRAHQIGELGGVMRVAMLEADVPFLAIAPTVLKKFVTGKGNAPKSVVMKYLLSYFKIDVDEDDAADATGLALMGAYLVGGYSRLTQARQDAFDKVELPAGAVHMVARVVPLEIPIRRRIRPIREPGIN